MDIKWMTLGAHERLCAMETRLQLNRSPPQLEIERGTASLEQ